MVLRHAVYLLNRFSAGSTNVTPVMAARGRELREPLAQFGELVNAKISEIGSKAVPSQTMLTSEGTKLARSVKRLILEEQWNGQLLRGAAGLPWAKTEGGRRAEPLRSIPHVQFLPSQEERAAVGAEALPVGNSGHSGNAGDTPGGDSSGASTPVMPGTPMSVSYTHLTLPTNREV